MLTLVKVSADSKPNNTLQTAYEQHTDYDRPVTIITNFNSVTGMDVSNLGLQLNHIITIIKKLIGVCF